MTRAANLMVLCLLSGCGLSGRGTRCGIVSLAGPTLLLEEFTKAGSTLLAVPDSMPEVIPVRVVAGPVQRGLVGRTDSAWVVGVDGPLATVPDPGFGVLLIDPVEGAQGVLLYEGTPILNAPVLGTVHAGATTLPLIGLRMPTAGFQDVRCPFFPDSLRH
jgi:hypothetical protein